MTEIAAASTAVPDAIIELSQKRPSHGQPAALAGARLAALAAQELSGAPLARPDVGTGPLRSGNPRGNPNLAPRCGAKARTTGCPCQAPAMPNGRCRMHGGKSTGARTAEGLATLARAHTTHGLYARSGPHAELRAQIRHAAVVRQRVRLNGAAFDHLPWLPPVLAARLREDTATELQAPRYHAPFQTTSTATPKPETQANAPDNLRPPVHDPAPRRDARGRFASRPKPALRGRRAELEAARLERERLAPWRAGIKRARLVKRLLMYQAQNARRAKRTQNSSPSPLPGTCSDSGTQRPATLATASLPVTGPHQGETPASSTRFKPARIEPLNPETAPNPTPPGHGANKIPSHPGTVAPPTGPAGTADAGGDQHALQSLPPGTCPGGGAAAHPARPAAQASACLAITDPPPNDTLAPNARIAIPRISPLASGTAARPTPPREGVSKAPLHSGTVARPTGPAAAPDTCGDKHALHPGAGGQPAAAATAPAPLASPPPRKPAPPPATEPRQHNHDQDRSDALHPGTVRPGESPFRRALLSSTASNTPEADKLAAGAERAGGWPVMMAAYAAKQAGLDWRPAATAARQRLIDDANRQRDRCAIRLEPEADLARTDGQPGAP